MGGEHDQVRAPWVKEGPEDTSREKVSRPDDEAISLGFMPEHIDIGTVNVGTDTIVEVAQPTLLNGSGAVVTTLDRPTSTVTKPSAFRDQLGLDPEPVLDDDQKQSFELVSAPMIPMATYGVQKPASIRLRVKPTRGGSMSTLVTVKAVGADGSIDARQIRVTAYAKPVPHIVDSPRAPEPAKGFEPPAPTKPLNRLASGEDTARTEVEAVVAKQLIGVDIAEKEVSSYKKAPPPRSEWGWIIDMAISMGVASIAGVIARLAATRMAQEIAGTRTVPAPIADKPVPGDRVVEGVETVTEQVPPNDKVVQLLSEGLKEGLKNSVKKGFPPANRRSRPTQAGPSQGEAVSEDPQIAFFAEHRIRIADVATHLKGYINTLDHQLKALDPDQADAALLVVADVLHHAAPSAVQLQTRATEFQWVAAAAKLQLGTRESKLPDGSILDTTNMDLALDPGESGLFAIATANMPKHEGILDLHVDLLAKGPADSTAFALRRASLLGVSQLVANRLRTADLAAAGIPIRLVVNGPGQSALITRDEVGNVRVSGLLRTAEGTERTEAHMHKGAVLLMSRVLAKTLEQSGLPAIETDDVTRRPKRAT